MLGYKSFAITIRPKNGLNGEYEEAINKFIQNHQYYAYNYEMEDQARHCHAQVFYDKPKRKSDVQKALKRIGLKHDPDWGPSAQKVSSGGVKIAYNDNFIDNYIQKDTEAEEYNPPDDTEPYYPTEAEQEKVLNRATAKDSYFNNLKELYGETKLEEDNKIHAILAIGDWYYSQMYDVKSIAVIADPKRFKQNIMALCHYLYPGKFKDLSTILTQEQIKLYMDSEPI